ncbi:MAG: MarR family transcriptional regulator [Patescibacteria group bacterium]|nr:MarR family transcriptional regulator [Patescibacteria group bacterium]
MADRKKVIREILENFQALRNKMHTRLIAPARMCKVTQSQFFILAMIARHKEMTVGSISKQLNISSSAVTQLMDGLAAKGYVRRKASARDRRTLYLTLSPAGRKCMRQVRTKGMRVMETLFDALDDRELETYRALHKKILLKASRVRAGK